MLSVHLEPRCTLDDTFPQHTNTTCVKGVLGLRKQGCTVQAKEDIKHLTNIARLARWSFVLYINSIILSKIDENQCKQTLASLP